MREPLKYSLLMMVKLTHEAIYKCCWHCLDILKPTCSVIRWQNWCVWIL